MTDGLQWAALAVLLVAWVVSTAVLHDSAKWDRKSNAREIDSLRTRLGEEREWRWLAWHRLESFANALGYKHVPARTNKEPERWEKAEPTKGGRK